MPHAVCATPPPLNPSASTLTDKDKACATVDSCCLPPFDGPFGLLVGQTDRQAEAVAAARHHRVATVAKWEDVDVAPAVATGQMTVNVAAVQLMNLCASTHVEKCVFHS